MWMSSNCPLCRSLDAYRKRCRLCKQIVPEKTYTVEQRSDYKAARKKRYKLQEAIIWRSGLLSEESLVAVGHYLVLNSMKWVNHLPRHGIQREVWWVSLPASRSNKHSSTLKFWRSSSLTSKWLFDSAIEVTMSEGKKWLRKLEKCFARCRSPYIIEA